VVVVDHDRVGGRSHLGEQPACRGGCAQTDQRGERTERHEHLGLSVRVAVAARGVVARYAGRLLVGVAGRRLRGVRVQLYRQRGVCASSLSR
jgi:hypothetical protein